MTARREQRVDRILRVLDHIQTHLDEPLTPADLAAVAGLSRHHFHRVFRGMTGESVMELVRRLRLERAAMRLKYGETSVTEVAFDVGYGSHEAFTRAFRARFGVAPSDYRGGAAVDDRPMELRDEPERRVVAQRFVGSYEDCGEAWVSLMAWAGPRGLAAAESIGLCYDDPDVTEDAKLRYDACLVVDEATFASLGELPPGLSRRRVPAGRYAVTLHEGSYDHIDQAYVALIGRWLPRRGIELADEPVMERYLNDPAQTPAADLRTEIAVRLR